MHLVRRCMIVKIISNVNHIIIAAVFRPEVRAALLLPSPGKCSLRHWATLGFLAFIDWLEKCERLTILLQRFGQNFTIYDLSFAASTTNTKAANLVALEASELQAMLMEQPIISNGVEVAIISPEQLLDYWHCFCRYCKAFHGYICQKLVSKPCHNVCRHCH